MAEFSIERRMLLRAMAGGAAVAGMTAATPALAERVCGDFDGYGMQQCEAGIRSELASLFAREVGSQEADQWCWAACMAMVFNFHGFSVSQERIVEDTWGSIVNMPGYPEQILGQLNRSWMDDRGRPFFVEADMATANQYTAAQDLTNDQPLIIGTMGHAMVLTSIAYVRDAAGNGEVTGVVVRDPWPGMGRRQLAGYEWYNAIFLARIRVYAT